jgi:hypothetical protein
MTLCCGANEQSGSCHNIANSLPLVEQSRKKQSTNSCRNPAKTSSQLHSFICSSKYIFIGKDGEPTLCCEANEQSGSGHNIANSIFLVEQSRKNQ